VTAPDAPLPAPTQLVGEFDAMKWATEFVRMHGGDESLMLGWFANAIMAGYDRGHGAGFRAGIESAAKVADTYDGAGHDHDQYTQLGNSVRTQTDIVAAIRALSPDAADHGDGK